MYDRSDDRLRAAGAATRGARPPRLALAAIIALTGLGLSACTYSERRMMKPGLLSPTLGPMVYKEEGSLILMTAGVNATRFHDDDPFIPLEVWLANKGVSPNLKITRESFYLVDTFGKRYGMAGVEEVMRLQKGVTIDRRMLNSAEFNGLKFDQYRWIHTNFFPQSTQGNPLIRDRAEIPRYGYIADILYFPRPDGELLGGIFELHLTAKELPQEIFVVFEVPG